MKAEGLLKLWVRRHMPKGITVGRPFRAVDIEWNEARLSRITASVPDGRKHRGCRLCTNEPSILVRFPANELDFVIGRRYDAKIWSDAILSLTAFDDGLVVRHDDGPGVGMVTVHCMVKESAGVQVKQVF